MKDKIHIFSFFSGAGFLDLGFEIASLDPVPGIDPTNMQSLNKGKFTTHPYFTSLQNLVEE